MPRFFCSVNSRDSHESPINSAWHAPLLITCEIPLPWQDNVLDAPKAPAGLMQMMMDAYERKGFGFGIIGVASDATYSTPGVHRVTLNTVQPDSLGRFARRSWDIPPEHLTESLAALIDGGDPIGATAVEDDGLRDYLICTHGAVDSCCATFGYPLYAIMRKLADNPDSGCRVWRASHFGGHRFAPTCLELPSGRYWGRLEIPKAASFLQHRQSLEETAATYRGSACLPVGLAQVAEGALLGTLGFSLDACKITALTIEPGTENPAHVSIDVTHPDGEQRRYVIAIREVGVISVPGSCTATDASDAMQYEADVISDQSLVLDVQKA